MGMITRKQLMELTGWSYDRVSRYGSNGVISVKRVQDGQAGYNLYNEDEVMRVHNEVNNYMPLQKFADTAGCAHGVIESLLLLNIPGFPKLVKNPILIQGRKMFKRDEVDIFLQNHSIKEFYRRKTAGHATYIPPPPRKINLFGVSYAI